MKEKITVYMMPGLAANPKIFEKIKLPNCYDIHWMHWIIPSKDEMLDSYVSRLISEQIKHPNPIILGVSFGGIIAQEIAKQIAVKQLVLISTVKTHNEFPEYFNKALQYKLYKFFPSRAMEYIDLLERMAFTTQLKTKLKLYKIYMDANDPKYLNWAIKTILHWQQPTMPENFIHIHGDKDKVFPIDKIQPPRIIIKGGRHDMILFKAKTINKHLANLLIK